ncbi:LOW QUALITY PROTEIN: hypothetical protein U9M48_029603 [Paspalum notatum var. saurae]|uniref:Uncharacterized protein n=1 Tax=Paspalum notatum var. saurae TaxID=547442 RepID=A0AAQ3X1R8_PASNO
MDETDGKPTRRPSLAVLPRDAMRLAPASTPSTELPKSRPPPSALTASPTASPTMAMPRRQARRGRPPSGHHRASTPPPPASLPRRAPHEPTLAASRCPSRRNRSRAAASARRRAAPVHRRRAASPLHPGRRRLGGRIVDGNIFPAPVGLKTGLTTAGATRERAAARAVSPLGRRYVIKKRAREITSTNGDPKDQLRPIHDLEGPSVVLAAFG